MIKLKKILKILDFTDHIKLDFSLGEKTYGCNFTPHYYFSGNREMLIEYMLYSHEAIAAVPKFMRECLTQVYDDNYIEGKIKIKRKYLPLTKILADMRYGKMKMSKSEIKKLIEFACIVKTNLDEFDKVIEDRGKFTKKIYDPGIYSTCLRPKGQIYFTWDGEGIERRNVYTLEAEDAIPDFMLVKNPIKIRESDDLKVRNKIKMKYAKKIIKMVEAIHELT